MNYKLEFNPNEKQSLIATCKRLFALLRTEKRSLYTALFFILITTTLTLLTPIVIARVIDSYVLHRDMAGIAKAGWLLFGLYVVIFIASYIQTKVTGGIGQRSLFLLRNTIFTTLQSLPLGFFQQNKAGDVISRINNDTEQLNDFFSRILVQLAGNLFIMVGAVGFILYLNMRLAIAALIPIIVLFVVTSIITPRIKAKNRKSLESVGALSAEIQESLQNFAVVVVFNRRDYFRTRFATVNEANYQIALDAGQSNSIVVPLYGLAAHFAQLFVMVYGIYLITHGMLTIGLLVGFLVYISRLYDPLRQVAALWVSMQTALAGWDRIVQITALVSDMPIVPTPDMLIRDVTAQTPVISFSDVSFHYSERKTVLRNASFDLLPGKTYALVGPTGGGKTTTASLMARLFDPSAGMISLNGRDIRSYTAEERTQHVGFILQEPFLFTGTLGDNIVYGNVSYHSSSPEQIATLLEERGLMPLLDRFEQGLATPVAQKGDTLSIGQKQIIAFIRAVLRDPSVLVLDEATANIDTVTENTLQDIIKALPASTTKVVIAHRLHTIANADEIFFVNNATITPAGSFDHAVEMIMGSARVS